MLSRRNIRIKVMQMLYALSRDNKLTSKEVVKGYSKFIQNSFELYLFNLLYLIKVTEYAKKDAERRAAKHLPTDEDKRFTPKLFNNPLMQALSLHSPLLEEFDNYSLEEILDEDSIRKFYLEFSKTEDCINYVLKDDCKNEDHQNILLKLYKYMTTSELFVELNEERFVSWVDDKSLIIGTMKKTLKLLPAVDGFLESFRPPYDTTVEFGQALLLNVIEKDAELLETIEPTLKNWDAERVAILDMILIKMALSELMIFPTIPTKVTLNEFVEISKMYSTDKSKDFINGILDRLMKKLNKEGKIKKEGRGLKE